MEKSVRRGKLFEMGPDGYGYLIDEAKPSNIYAFHTSMIEGSVPEGEVVDFEDCVVSFTLLNERPAQIEIIQFRPKAASNPKAVSRGRH
jgi:hypothetical protein